MTNQPESMAPRFTLPLPTKSLKVEYFGEGGPETIIAVTLDRGQPSETYFAVPPNLAWRLGNQLIAMALGVPELCDHGPLCPLCGIGPEPPTGWVQAFKTGKWPDRIL
jgi:hypothetical protein